MKTVLIAHQSTIPHYRVSFYNALERLRPNTWDFEVVFDSSEATSPQFFKEGLTVSEFGFPTLDVKTLTFRPFVNKASYQTFWLEALKYDLVVVEHAVNNLTYPLCHLHQLLGVKVAYWGHGRDRNIAKASGLKLVAEKLKLFLARKADGFFAYTPGVKAYLETQDVVSDKIFILNNTIDINEQRAAFTKFYPDREKIREHLGVRGKKVLLFVGRFTKNKRLSFLLDAFSILRKNDPDFHLLLVGDGDAIDQSADIEGLSFLGPLVDLEKLGPIYVASDIYVYPGAVGLAPLQALCYDLPVVTIDLPTHKPEIEYLTSDNSIILDRHTTPEGYAQAILELFRNSMYLNSLRQSIWPGIKHLTIDQMARNFIQGVNTILSL